MFGEKTHLKGRFARGIQESVRMCLRAGDGKGKGECSHEERGECALSEPVCSGHHQLGDTDARQLRYCAPRARGVLLTRTLPIRQERERATATGQIQMKPVCKCDSSGNFANSPVNCLLRLISTNISFTCATVLSALSAFNIAKCSFANCAERSSKQFPITIAYFTILSQFPLSLRATKS